MAQLDTVPQQIPVVGGAVLVRCPDNNDGGPPKTYLINYVAGSTMPPQKPGTAEIKPRKKMSRQKKTRPMRKGPCVIQPKSDAACSQTLAPQSNASITTSTTTVAMIQQSAANVSPPKVGVISRMVTRNLGKKRLAIAATIFAETPGDSKCLAGKTSDQNQLNDGSNSVSVAAARKQKRQAKLNVNSPKSNTELSTETVPSLPAIPSKKVKRKPGRKPKPPRYPPNSNNSRPDELTAIHPSDPEMDASTAKRQKSSYRVIKPYLKIEDVIKAMTKVPFQKTTDNQGIGKVNVEENIEEELLGVEAATDVTRKEARKNHENAIVTQTNTTQRSQKVIQLPLMTKLNLELEDILIEVEVEKGLSMGYLERKSLKNGNSKYCFRVSNEIFESANNGSSESLEGYTEMEQNDTPLSEDNCEKENDLEISGHITLKLDTQQEIFEKNVEDEDRDECVTEEFEMNTSLIAQQVTSDRSPEAPGGEISSDIDGTEKASIVIIVTDDNTLVDTDTATDTVLANDISIESGVDTALNEGKTTEDHIEGLNKDKTTEDHIEGLNKDKTTEDHVEGLNEDKTTEDHVEGLAISSDNLASILSTDSEDPTFTAPMPHTKRKRGYVKLNQAQDGLDYRVRVDDSGKRVYICNICGHEAKGNMSSHFRMHYGEKPYQCTLCGKAFNNKSNLNTHILRHNPERPFSCKVCGYTCKTSTYLRVHSERHNTRGKHMCQFCGKCFHTPRELKAHMQMHNKEPMYECRVCKKKFQYEYTQRRHENLHVSGGIHQCHVCGATFSRSDYYRLHLRKKHMDKQTDEQLCKKSTETKKSRVKAKAGQESLNQVLTVDNGSEATYQPLEEVTEVNGEAMDSGAEIQIVYVDGTTEIPSVVQEVEVEMATHELATFLASFQNTS